MSGAGGFIGGHLVDQLLRSGHQVRASDVKPWADWWQVHDAAVNLPQCDASVPYFAEEAVADAEWVYDLAEDMGGIAWITSERVACAESITIGINLLRAAEKAGAARFFFASSACVYNTDLQTDPAVTALSEDMAWPARPEEGYGLCKLYMEELCRHYTLDGRLDTRVARYHNIYGPHGSWTGGKEKSPAALCRKVAEASDGDSIEVWGDGTATRSYCHVEDCVLATQRLMASDYPHPLNIGSDRLISVDALARLIIGISGKELTITHVPGPVGVAGRNSDNTRCREVLGWEPFITLEEGLRYLYWWIEKQVASSLS